MWTHIAVLALQLTLVGRLIKRFGLGVALAILPVITAAGFIGLAIYGSFLVLILLEAATHAVQRGITQPAREMLFTAVDREDKYKAKAFIDTFIYRAGDVVGAQTEGALGRLGMAMGGLVSLVLPLALAWVMLGLWLGRAQARRAALPTSAASVHPDSEITVRQTVEVGADSAPRPTVFATKGQKPQSAASASSLTA
jgi:AAA family ATP:ADP antiporter